MRSSAEDRAVLLDARIGAIKAVLKLTPDQEKLWAPVEAAHPQEPRLRDEARPGDARAHGAKPRWMRTWLRPDRAAAQRRPTA